ncbi:MAG TPA: S-layer homology domain-containing protein [Nodosilinea sp.]|nr:S-layer homology domain-containing protein [Nodosilinea sp.]
MPPLFRPSLRLAARPQPQAGSRFGPRLKRRLRRLVPVGLCAIAAAGALAAWSSGRRPHPDNILTAAAPTQRRSLADRLPLVKRQIRPAVPLAVPPPVLPSPLPPHQAWPELPRLQPQVKFTDLTAQHWAWPILSDLAQRDLVTGFPDGSFRPAQPMTRMEFAAQLARLFHLQPAPTPAAVAYPDLSASHWAHSSIQKSVQMGFLSGYPDGAFRPDQTISRLHVIVALANGLMLKSASSPAQVLAAYRDRTQVPPWATRPLVSALEAGLIVNYPDPLALTPDQPASRAEVAVMVHRALVYTGSLEAIPLAALASSSTNPPAETGAEGSP